MKRTIVMLCMMLGGILCSCSQGVECHIQGTIDDTATKELFLVEAGEDMRIMENVLTIPVTDGKFQYDLKTDMIRYYELIPVNQYEYGSFLPAFFIAENQAVTISYADGKVTVSGNGKEQKKVQQYKEEVADKFFAICDSVDVLRDSVGNILEARVDEMTEDERQTFFSDFENSTDSDVMRFKDLNDKYRETLCEERLAKIKWLDDHPCFYGFADIKTMLPSADPSDEAPIMQDLILSYRNTYSKRFAGHPYHEHIANMIRSKELAVGNKYIDYLVPDYEGNPVMISSLYKGKIMIIDLWASWCGPCRRHSMALIPIYQRFKDKGLQVIAIARESGKERMLAAMKKDGYPWDSLIDLNDRYRIWQKNGAGNGGGIIYIVSADGTILAVNPTAEETERILKQQLGE